MSNYLITGSSRGIGFELVKQLLAFPANEVNVIIATARSYPDNLKSLTEANPKRVIYVQLDVGDKNSVRKAAEEVEQKLQGKALDVLVNNAAVLKMSTVEDMGEILDDLHHANVTSVHMVTQAFLPLLRKGNGRKVVNMSSTVGSISLAGDFLHAPTPAYKITKAALNMLTVQYAYKYEDEGFTFILLSPGWLKTDGGTEYADLPVEVGVKASLDIIMKATKETNGQFRNIRVSGWEDKDPAHVYDGKNPGW